MFVEFSPRGVVRLRQSEGAGKCIENNHLSLAQIKTHFINLHGIQLIVFLSDENLEISL